jgi:hypothetical protein
VRRVDVQLVEERALRSHDLVRDLVVERARQMRRLGVAFAHQEGEAPLAGGRQQDVRREDL